MDEAQRLAFLEAIGSGLSLEQAASLAGIGGDVKQLVARDAALRDEAIDREARLEAELLGVVMDAIEGGDAEAAEWWLSRTDLASARAHLAGYLSADRWETVQRRAEELAG